MVCHCTSLRELTSHHTDQSQLLTSSTFAYTYGVCGPFWYGCLGCLQILLFAMIAVKIKANAPGAHTFPEIVLARHGKVAHITYLVAGLCCNMLVGACLVLGGSQVVAALSGMNVYASCWLIPFVVAAYVVAGGLRSTFIADYLHTVILFIAIFVFSFLVWATSDVLGSPSRVYDLLVEASEKMPIEGNKNGSYLAFRSVNGLVFAVDLLVAGFCTVWLDQAYWQRAIASRPETSIQAYILGGIAWYGIPFGFASAMGLGCAALTNTPSFPTYPNPLSTAQNGAGLSSPATAIALLGKGGAVLMLLLLFMAVTSSTSAELIAVSSLLTFDVYKTYIRPETSSAKLVTISHYGIGIYSVVLAAFCCILNAVGVNLTWLLTVLGIIVGGAAVPVGLVLLWDRMSTPATVFTPYIALSFGLISWFVTAQKRSGGISIETTGDTTNAVAGNVTSCAGGAVVAIILSLLFPQKHVSTDPKAIERYNKIQGIPPTKAETPSGTGTPPPAAVPEEAKEKSDDPEASAATATPPNPRPKEQTKVRTNPQPETFVPTGNELVDFLEASHMEPMDPVLVKKGMRLAVGANLVFAGVAAILVPFTLFGTGYICKCILTFYPCTISCLIPQIRPAEITPGPCSRSRPSSPCCHTLHSLVIVFRLHLFSLEATRQSAGLPCRFLRLFHHRE